MGSWGVHILRFLCKHGIRAPQLYIRISSAMVVAGPSEGIFRLLQLWFIADKYLPCGLGNYFLTALGRSHFIIYTKYKSSSTRVWARTLFTHQHSPSGVYTHTRCHRRHTTGAVFGSLFIMLIYHVADFVCVDIQEHGPLRDAWALAEWPDVCVYALFQAASAVCTYLLLLYRSEHKHTHTSRRISWMHKKSTHALVTRRRKLHHAPKRQERNSGSQMRFLEKCHHADNEFWEILFPAHDGQGKFNTHLHTNSI